MSTPLRRIDKGSYRHERLGVEVQRTAMADFPWELTGPDPTGSGVVLARTLRDARAFLQEIEAHADQRPDRLLELHRHLFPERYEDVPAYEWDAGTIEEVAAMLERALDGNPRARLSPQ